MTSKAELQQQLAEAQREGDQYKVAYYHSQLNAIEQAEAADKALADQASAVISGFTLPQDYDEYTGITGMNAEITALITQVSEQLNAVYLAERDAMQQAHKEAMASMQAAVDSLTTTVSDDKAEIKALQEQIYQAQLDASDAASKRDNAVAAMEEAQAERDKAVSESRSLRTQVDELERTLSEYKKAATPAAGAGFKLTSTLKQESEEEKKARLEKQRLELINRNLSEKYGLEPLKMPTIPAKEETVTPEALDAAFQSVDNKEAVVRANTGGDGVQAPEEAVAATADGAAGITLEALAREIAGLKVRVTKLETVA